ncbi:MAG: 30S ribosomal protein S13 [bacterium]|nr:30S ribosomal protein S13 [bacterium]
MAARIAGVTLPQNKRIEIALTYIYGIGKTLSNSILVSTNIDPNIRTNELNDEQVNKLREIIEKNHKVEGELRRDILLNIKRLKEIGSYRGTRHSKNLPVRGQRTKTNCRTVRGNTRRTMGSGRVNAADKK